jgi:hypothetical protein
MKKDIAKQLSDLADELPTVFDTRIGSVLMSGEELNLTPLGDKQRFDKEQVYSVPVPEYHAVEHRQQLKDAYKRLGMEGVREYTKKVMEDYKESETIKVDMCGNAKVVAPDILQPLW